MGNEFKHRRGIPAKPSAYDIENAARQMRAEEASIRAEEEEALLERERQRLEAERIANRSGLTIKPGSQHANAAYKAGREDEYINGMEARYGEGW